MNYDQLKLDNQLCFPFYAVSRLIIRAYQEDLDALGITYPQYLVMLVLWENDGLTVNEITEKLILNTNTVTPLLKRMEVMGLLTRTTSTKDQRKVVVELTEKGKTMQIKAGEIPERLMHKLKIEQNPEQISNALILKNQLYELIRILNTSLSEK